MNASSDQNFEIEKTVTTPPEGGNSGAPEGGYSGEDLKHLSDLEHVRARPGCISVIRPSRGCIIWSTKSSITPSTKHGGACQSGLRYHQFRRFRDGRRRWTGDSRTDRHAQLSEEMEKRCQYPRRGDDRSEVWWQVREEGVPTFRRLHGVGVTVVNFLSQWCEVEVYRNGKVYTQSYERGVATGPVREVGDHQAGHQNNLQARWQIFPNTKFFTTRWSSDLQELAFLNSGVRIKVRDERNDLRGTNSATNEASKSSSSILNRASDVVHKDVILIEGKEGDFGYDRVAVLEEYTENLQSYCNNIHTLEGGTHVSGFRPRLTRTLNNYGKKENLFKDLESDRVMISAKA
jgi:DNA gyrase subunit B